jgi:hypothetical protein
MAADTSLGAGGDGFKSLKSLKSLMLVLAAVQSDNLISMS